MQRAFVIDYKYLWHEENLGKTFTQETKLHWKENYRKDNIKDVSYFNTGFVKEVFRTILVVSISDQQCLSNNINWSTIF